MRRMALLERSATPVADYPVERAPGTRAYEIFDLSYVPFDGFATLERPGPRLRLWRLPAASEAR